MSRHRRSRAPSGQIQNQLQNDKMLNGLTDMSFSVAANTTGGSYLSSYNTWAFSNNYSLLTLNRIILTYMYVGNGIFQTAIQLPIQDAIGKGIEIDSGEMDNSDIDAVLDYWEEHGIWQTLMDVWTWIRLFGGGAILINTNQDPEKPLTFNNLRNSPIELYDLDRWQLDTNMPYFDAWDSGIGGENQDEIIHLFGERIHASRFLRGYGKRAPHYVRRQLRGWGMSEGERMVRDLNLYLKTQDASFELIDEAKIDVYHIKNLASKLLTSGGVSYVTNRVQLANEIKNYVNALILDSEEQWDQKQMSFTGLAEVMQQNRIGVAAALRMPLTKLFGLSASGFNTGESDLENYNANVESEIRKPMRPMIRQLLKITMAHLFGYVPEFTFSYPSLRELTPEIEQQVKDGEYNRAMGLYDRGLLDSQETMQILRKSRVVDIETKTEKGIVPNPVPPNGEEAIEGKTFPGKPEQEAAPVENQPIRVIKKINNAGKFEESKHKRDEGGKFSKGGGGGSGSEDRDDKIKKEVLTSLNPTGSVFVDYTPEERMKMDLGENITTLAETADSDPDEIVTIYRGVPNGNQTIRGGDFITTNKQLAKDYAGTGKVISLEVRMGDILDDKDEPLGEEYIYWPKEEIVNSDLRIFRKKIENAEFKESEHPRAEDGKFGSGGGKSKGAEESKKKDAEGTDPKKEYEEIEKKYIGTKNWMKAPNGNPTKLNQKQWIQARTKSFKNWFGDWENDPEKASKIVDENGEPKIVYHGTNAIFEEFSHKKIGRFDSGFRGKGFYFSESSGTASKFAKDKYGEENPYTGSIYSVFLDIKKPFDFNSKIPDVVVDSLNNKIADFEKQEKEMDLPDDPYQDILDMLLGENKEDETQKIDKIGYGTTPRETLLKNYDSEIFSEALAENGYDGIMDDMHEIVAFAPNQIKSAIGNAGNFNPDDNSIKNTAIKIYRKKNSTAADLKRTGKYIKGETPEPDKTELKKGIEIELEHTDDRKTAEQIALDHLVEDSRYYSKLIKAGL